MPFREPKFIGSRTTLQIVRLAIEQRKTFNLIYDNTVSEFRMYAVDGEAYPSVLIAGGGGGWPGDDIQSVGFANDPGTHDTLYARDDHIHAGLGDMVEKMWGPGNYHDLHSMPSGYDVNMPLAHSSRFPSQRCIAYFLDSTYILWHDGITPNGTQPALYITREETITGRVSIFKLSMEDFDHQALVPNVEDFCMTVDVSGFLHIVFTASDGGEDNDNALFDGIVNVSAFVNGETSPVPTDITVTCEWVAWVGYTWEIDTLTLDAVGYVDCVPGDLLGVVTDDSGGQGILTGYNNITREWTVRIGGTSPLTPFTPADIAYINGTAHGQLGAGPFTIINYEIIAPDAELHPESICHPSIAAAEPVNGGVVVVYQAWIHQDPADVSYDRIINAPYYPANPVSLRYEFLPPSLPQAPFMGPLFNYAISESDSSYDSRYPTVECSTLGTGTSFMYHVAWIQDCRDNRYQLMYAYFSSVSSPYWSVCAEDEPVNYFSGETADYFDAHIHEVEDPEFIFAAPSMTVVVGTLVDAAGDPILNQVCVSVAIMDLSDIDGEDPNLSGRIEVYHFTPDITSGAPTVFSDEYTAVNIDPIRLLNGVTYLWNDGDQVTEMRRMPAYQMGVSDIAIIPNNHNCRHFLYYYSEVVVMAEGVVTTSGIVDAMMSYRRSSTIRDGAREAWYRATVKSGVSFSRILPKVHFATFGNGRQWRSNIYMPWYPINIYGWAYFSFPATNFTPISPEAIVGAFYTTVMSVKDIPRYPMQW